MRSALPVVMVAALGLLVGACTADGAAPTSPESPAIPEVADALSGNANLEVILRGDGFGLVKFRQPKDDVAIIYLDTWVRDLAPNTEYLLQRAVDVTLDGDCTSTAWLTLGQGLEPRSIVTDANGTGREQLFRDLSAVAPGSEFDIHFRVVNAQTQALTLESGCYAFRVSP